MNGPLNFEYLKTFRDEWGHCKQSPSICKNIFNVNNFQSSTSLDSTSTHKWRPTRTYVIQLVFNYLGKYLYLLGKARSYLKIVITCKCFDLMFDVLISFTTLNLRTEIHFERDVIYQSSIQSVQIKLSFLVLFELVKTQSVYFFRA